MDLELELELVTRGRGDMIRNMELNSREKFAAETEILKREVAQLREIPDHDPRSSNGNNTGSVNMELESANKMIDQLKATIKTLEIRNKASTSSFLRAYTSSSSLNPGILGIIPKNVPPSPSPRNASLGNSKQGTIKMKQGSSSGTGTPTKLEMKLARGRSGSGNGQFKSTEEDGESDSPRHVTGMTHHTHTLHM